MAPAMITAAMALAIAGCARRGGARTAYAVRDSAGVRIIRYSVPPPDKPAVHFASRPTYRYGQAAGERTFDRITSGALEPDGSAVVADAGTEEVTELTPAGDLKDVLAHAGQGPEELRGVQSVNVLGQDTIVVEDDGNGRLMEFDDGTPGRSVSTAGTPDLSYRLLTIGVDSAGRLLMVTSAYHPGFAGPWFEGSMVRFDMATDVADTVASYDMVPSTPMRGPTNPFGPFGVVGATAGSFVRGRSDVRQLTWLTSGGEVRQIVRWVGSPTYPADADVRAFQEDFRAQLRRVNPHLPRTQLDALIKGQMKRFQVVSDAPMPLFRTLLGDGQGGVWMGEYEAGGGPDGPRRFDVIAPDGAWLGTADLPARFRLLAVRSHRALGVMRDSMDAESVAVFRFTMQPADPR